MSVLGDYLTAIDELVPGTLPLGESEKTKAVRKAVNTHSRYRPRQEVEDRVGTGAFDYALNDLAFWEDDFSQILSIEYPVDDDAQEASVLTAEEDWTIYQKPETRFIRFLSATPELDVYFRVTYTARHSCEETACTVAAPDEEAVQTLAASFFCRMLAAAYAQDQDSTIAADSVDHSSKRREYETQAAKYRAEYDEHMGIGQAAAAKPASGMVDWDVNYPDGTDRLTHPRRYR